VSVVIINKELKEFLEIEGIRKNLSLKGLIKLVLKYQLYFLILGVYYLAILIGRAKQGVITLSYGILKPCKRCVWGKKKESIAIVSLYGYSRDDKVIHVMNYKGKNWANRGSCKGYSSCYQCLNEINLQSNTLPCRWKEC